MKLVVANSAAVSTFLWNLITFRKRTCFVSAFLTKDEVAKLAGELFVFRSELIFATGAEWILALWAISNHSCTEIENLIPILEVKDVFFLFHYDAELFGLLLESLELLTDHLSIC